MLREILELERQGERIAAVVPLFPLDEPVRHAAVARLRAPVLALPMLSGRIVGANVRWLVRSPGRYLGTLFRALRGTRRSRNAFLGALALFPKATWLAEEIQRGLGDHVHAHFATHPALAAMIAHSLTGVPFSFTAHAHDLFVDPTMLCEKLEESDFTVTISDFNRRWIEGRCGTGSAAKVHVIRCGIDASLYAAAALPGEESAVRVACVASLEEYKGLEYLLRAVQEVRGRGLQVRCRVAGGGSQRRALVASATEKGLEENVRFLGHQTEREVRQLLLESDIFVLPSVVAGNGQMEGIPVALMEAMATGLPVVASDLSGIPELVEHEVSGLLCPPRDHMCLADAVERLANDSGLRQRLGTNGRRRVESEFSLESSAQALRRLFGETRGHGGTYSGARYKPPSF